MIKMATNMDKESSELLLDCPNCLDKLSSPKQLSCTHFVCKNCIDDIKGGQNGDTKAKLLCPFCKKYTKSDDLKDMPFVDKLCRLFS